MSGGKPCGGCISLIYYAEKHTVELHMSASGVGCKGGTYDEYLFIPEHIQYENDLVEYIIQNKPEWGSMINRYQNRYRFNEYLKLQKKERINPRKSVIYEKDSNESKGKQKNNRKRGITDRSIIITIIVLSLILAGLLGGFFFHDYLSF